jgi:hypothetical protein
MSNYDFSINIGFVLPLPYMTLILKIIMCALCTHYDNLHYIENFLTYPINVVIEWLKLLLRILEVPVSNLGPDIGYTDFSLSLFSWSFQANASIIP